MRDVIILPGYTDNALAVADALDNLGHDTRRIRAVIETVQMFNFPQITSIPDVPGLLSGQQVRLEPDTLRIVSA